MRKPFARFNKAVRMALGVALPLLLTASAARAEVSFRRDIAPILLRKCVGCHGDRTNFGGYRAQNYQNLLRAGASGIAPIVPGKPLQSRMYQLIVEKNEALRMPKSDDALPAAALARIRQWIAEGAKFDGADRSAALKELLGARKHPAAPQSYRAPVPVLALALLPGQDRVAVGGYNEVTIWSISDHRLARRIGGLPQRIQSITPSPDGGSLLIAGGIPGEYGELTRVDLTPGGETRVLDTFADICLTAVYSPDGKRIAAGGADNAVRVYEAASGKRLWISAVHSDWVTAVAFSGDEEYVASASRDMTVKINVAANGDLYTTFNGHNRQIGQYNEHAPVFALQFEPAGHTAYSAGAGRWIQRWDPVKAKAESGDAGDMEDRFSKQSHALHVEHGFQHEVFALKISSGFLFAASADGIVKQFDLAGMKEIRAFQAAPEWLFSVDYDPKSGLLAAGSYGGRVSIWNAATGAPLGTFANQPGRERMLSGSIGRVF